MYCCSSYMVRATMPMCGNSRLIWRVASTPPMRGMLTSMRITSGINVLVFSTASIPSWASPTTLISSFVLRIAARPSRTTRWSSAIRTLIFSIVRALLLAERHFDDNRGAASLFRIDPRFSPDELRPLDNAAYAEVIPFLRIVKDLFHVESDAVIRDRDFQCIKTDDQAHGDAVGFGVLDDVAQGF